MNHFIPDIREYVLSQYPKGTSSSSYAGRAARSLFDPLVAYAGASSSTGFATASDGGLHHHAGIEDVIQLGDALESMFNYESAAANCDDALVDAMIEGGASGAAADLLAAELRLSDIMGDHHHGAGSGGHHARFLSNGHLPSTGIGKQSKQG